MTAAFADPEIAARFNALIAALGEAAREVATVLRGHGDTAEIISAVGASLDRLHDIRAELALLTQAEVGHLFPWTPGDDDRPVAGNLMLRLTARPAV